jgi:hypothetical protein
MSLCTVIVECVENDSQHRNNTKGGWANQRKRNVPTARFSIQTAMPPRARKGNKKRAHSPDGITLADKSTEVHQRLSEIELEGG